MVKQVITCPNKQPLRAWIPQYNYVNTNEIELSGENMISSQVKITCYLHVKRSLLLLLHNKSRFRSQIEVAWHFISVYIILVNS